MRDYTVTGEKYLIASNEVVGGDVDVVQASSEAQAVERFLLTHTAPSPLVAWRITKVTRS